jgi:hypothetical protein
METRKAQIRTPGSRTDADVLEAIDDGLGRGGSPRQVHGALIHVERFKGRVPSLKTITRRAKQRRPPAAEERWSLAEAGPDEAAAVLPVFAALARRDQVWKCSFITRDHAQMLVLIRAVAPDLDPWVAYMVADEYLLRRRGGEPTLGFELGLALSPWRSEEAAAGLQRVIDAGFLSRTVRADIRQLTVGISEARRDPIADALDRLEERRTGHEAVEDYWSDLSDEEQDAVLSVVEEGARELGLGEPGSD